MLKFATFEVLGSVLVPADATRTLRRAIGHKHHFAYTPRAGYLYVRSRAISSRCNDNFDEFPGPEIKEGFKTFIGKPVFVNHNNDNHRRARGVVIDAALHEDRNPDGSPDIWVEALMEVDAIRFPKLAKAILAGEIARTSMGTDVEYSHCSVCNNRATTPAEYCAHIPRMKGQRIYRHTANGKKEGILVREICYGLRFFENSLLVEPPADPTSYFLGVDTRGIDKAASKKTAHDEDDEYEDENEPQEYDSHISYGNSGIEASAHGQHLTRYDPETGKQTHNFKSFDDAMHTILHKHHDAGEDSRVWVHGEHGPVYREGDSDANRHIEEHLPNYMGEGHPQGNLKEHTPVDEHSSASDIRGHMLEDHGVKHGDLHDHVQFGGNRLNEIVEGIGRGMPSAEMHTSQPHRPVKVPKEHDALLADHAELHEPGQCPAGDKDCTYPNNHTHSKRDTSHLFDPSIFSSEENRDAARGLLDENKQGPTKYSSKDELFQHFAGLDRDDPSAVHLETHPGHPDSPTLCNRRGAQYQTHTDPSHATCGECLAEHEGQQECDHPYCQESGFADGWHTKAEHIDPSHLDEGHEDYQSAEKNINDAIGGHPDAWLFNHQDEGPTKYSMLQKGAPFAGYKDFDACVAANSDKDNPEAYCGKIKHQVEGMIRVGVLQRAADWEPGSECESCGSAMHTTDEHHLFTEEEPEGHDEHADDGIHYYTHNQPSEHIMWNAVAAYDHLKNAHGLSDKEIDKRYETKKPGSQYWQGYRGAHDDVHAEHVRQAIPHDHGSSTGPDSMRSQGAHDPYDIDKIQTNEKCPECGKPADHIHISPEAQDEMRAAAEAGQMHADMADSAQKRVVNTKDPHDLKAHLMEAHGYDEDSDFYRGSHDDDHPALKPRTDDFDHDLDDEEVHSLHNWEHGHGIENEHPDYAGGERGHFLGESHFHQAALRKEADEDQCPNCGDDALIRKGAYQCQGCGHRFPIQSQAARDEVHEGLGMPEAGEEDDPGKALGRHLWNGFVNAMGFDSTDEMRLHTQNKDSEALRERFKGGSGRHGFEDDQGGDAYYEVRHPSGWKARAYNGGPNVEVSHVATPGEAHDVIDVAGQGRQTVSPYKGEKPQGYHDTRDESKHYVETRAAGQGHTMGPWERNDSGSLSAHCIDCGRSAGTSLERKVETPSDREQGIKHGPDDKAHMNYGSVTHVPCEDGRPKMPDSYGHDDLKNDLHEWVQDYSKDYEDNDPKIKRWKNQRTASAVTIPKQTPTGEELADHLIEHHAISPALLRKYPAEYLHDMHHRDVKSELPDYDSDRTNVLHTHSAMSDDEFDQLTNLPPLDLPGRSDNGRCSNCGTPMLSGEGSLCPGCQEDGGGRKSRQRQKLVRTVGGLEVEAASNPNWGLEGLEKIHHEYTGRKPAAPVMNNTTVWKDEDGNHHLRLHDTDVVSWTPDKSKVTLRSGGYHSPTTKHRINNAVSNLLKQTDSSGRHSGYEHADRANLGVNQHQHNWYVNGHNFEDGISFNGHTGERIEDDAVTPSGGDPGSARGGGSRQMQYREPGPRAPRAIPRPHTFPTGEGYGEPGEGYSREQDRRELAEHARQPAGADAYGGDSMTTSHEDLPGEHESFDDWVNRTAPTHREANPITKCDKCQGRGRVGPYGSKKDCNKCQGAGYFNAEGEPHKTAAFLEKQAVYAATMRHYALRAIAFGETKAPADVDTLRDEECPVCGDADSYDGTECQVCGFIAPPKMFQDPDLDLAKQVDLRQDENAMQDANAGMPDEVPGSEFAGTDETGELGGVVDPAQVAEDGSIAGPQVGDDQAVVDGEVRTLADDEPVDPTQVDEDGNILQPEMDPDAANTHFNQGGEPFTPGPNAPTGPGGPEQPEGPIDEGANEEGYPGTPGDQVPDLTCPSCGFQAPGASPMSSTMSDPMAPGAQPDGLLVGDVCPNCQRATLLSAGEINQQQQQQQSVEQMQGLGV